MKPVLLLVCILTSFPALSQIVFIDAATPWEKLSARAKEEDKLIFIHLENTECVQCNEVASMAFNHPDVTEKFAKNFVSIRCNVATENGRALARKFGAITSLMSIYADPAGNILHVNNGSTSSVDTYLSGADLALSRKGQKQVADYAREYQAGERSADFMRAYMVKKRETSMVIDDLLDEYVEGLPEDSLRNFNTVKFIYQMSPSLDSRAFDRVRQKTPTQVVDSIYRVTPPEERKALNDGIIENSFRNAVMRRDEKLALSIAEFTKNTYEENRVKGIIAYQKSMIRYYQTVSDTAKYFEATQRLLDEHHMRMTVDSLNAMDDAEMRAAMPRQHRFNPMVPAGQRVSRVMIGVMPPSQFIHGELNNHAFHYYKITNNKALLEKALTWSKRSMELLENPKRQSHPPYKTGYPAYFDTYAHILYKLNRRDEAIEWQTKAVEAQKVAGIPSGSFEITLTKMKAGTL
ncbi:thioredoxin family protein [Dyadobacter sp. MSC1_007]|jgi:tetratricopeptide (TPR) repeat protein|uniref:thioredoxin family protein n=1 Tax=Dyadobacter sp. MSC1_007 TaxID=2909264 RepID=UPI00202FE29A|nr:thioredoxin family protein [Dyadobacter sp. MSC1_007]